MASPDLPEPEPEEPPFDEAELRRRRSEPVYTTAEVLTHLKRLEEAEKFGREPRPPHPCD
jgi:hypothetical protein